MFYEKKKKHKIVFYHTYFGKWKVKGRKQIALLQDFLNAFNLPKWIVNLCRYSGGRGRQDTVHSTQIFLKIIWPWDAFFLRFLATSFLLSTFWNTSISVLSVPHLTMVDVLWPFCLAALVQRSRLSRCLCVFRLSGVFNSLWPHGL